MLSPEPLQGLDLMTQKAYHRTNIERDLSKNKSVLCRPSPVSKDGFGRTDRTNSLQPTCAPWYGGNELNLQGSVGRCLITYKSN